jgi:hypothetical protein
MEGTMARTKTQERLLTPLEVHKRTGIALQTLANWRSRDMLHPERPSNGPVWVKVSGKLNQPGGEVRYPEKTLAVWEAARSKPEVPPVHRAALRPSA